MKKTFFLFATIITSVAYFSLVSCDKEPHDSVNVNSAQSKNNDFKLLAEVTTESTYERSELLDLGSVYESQWEERYFKNGEFKYDVIITTNVLDAQLTILDCNHDKIIFETKEGDTMTLFNIKSCGKNVTFDMLRDDNSVAHFRFTTGEDLDFVNELQLFMHGNNAQFAITFGTAMIIISAATGTTAATFAIISYVQSKHNRKCDILKQNYTDRCKSYKCGVWRGDCCVRCTGGSNHPKCDHKDAVYGEGSDCNSH
ncbi:MAG: hypothetical protein AUK63_1084 [bacterium P3]|nr:MAG: hypothetical protein AUK63_1084 [bacterium P3]KWW40777.1 MAG: hypothetical protein F083_1432 [bacterium F083]